MAIELGPGVVLGAGVRVGGPTPTPLSSANIYYSMQSIINGAADGTSITSLTNYGTGGTTYAATNVPGRTAPSVATVGGVKTLLMDGYGNNQWGYNIANAFTVSNGSFFMVGWNAFGTDYNYQSRVMGFGGQRYTPYQLCFFGFSKLNNGSFLFRDTGDSGVTLDPTFSSASLQVFGIVKTGTTVVYYDNDTTPVTYPGVVIGNYGFNTVGYRSYGFEQPSTGYLGDVAYFDTALSVQDAASVITQLKSIYNIA